MKRMSPVLAFGLLCACGGDDGPRSDASDSSQNTLTDTTIGTTGADTTGSGGTSSTTDPTATGTGQGSETGIMCGDAEYMVEAIPPNVVLVLDKSGSMAHNFWDHDNDMMTADIIRWTSLHTVVEFVVTTFDAGINFGAVLFPSQDAQGVLSPAACVVNMDPEVPVAPMNAAAVLAGIPAADDDTLEGATPATSGIETAVNHLVTLDPGVPRYMILVTDGAANCSEDAQNNNDLFELYDVHLEPAVASALADDDISTFVVGIDIKDEVTGEGLDGNPEANMFIELNKIAVAGGVPQAGAEKFYNAADEIELQAALNDIVGEEIDCIVRLDPEPEFPAFVEIEVGGVNVPHANGPDLPIDLMANMDCANSDGWIYTNPGGPYDEIQLCGSSCANLKEEGSLQALYNCPPPP